MGIALAGLDRLETPVSGAEEEIALARRRQSDYSIVLGREASPSEQHAAAELQHFLAQISGARLPVVTEEAAGRGPFIFVGEGELLRRRVDLNFRATGPEGFTMRTVGRDLVLAGGRLRGTMYAVYTFLDEKLGCRWFSSKVSQIPAQDDIRFAPFEVTFRPKLEYREPFYTDAFDADYAARNRANSSSARLGPERGGKVQYAHFVHTFYDLLPPAEFFAAHPEYFSEVNGTRTADHAQLCLTNPEVLRIATERVRRWIAEAPEANIYSVSQNDWHGWCTCPNCAALDEREGSHSGTVLNFANSIAEAIERDHPDKAIDTLAYQYTRKPPKTIRPRPNVIVRLCSIECCFAHPLESCPVNASFRSDIEGWSKIADRLYVWDYVTDFGHYLQPFSNLEVLGPNLRFFVNHSVRGIFEEGNYAPGGGGEMAELRAWMLSKLLWNPGANDAALRQEFLEGYYGAAAWPIGEYLRLLHDRVRKENLHLYIWTGPQDPIFSPDVVARADELFEQAEAAADTDDLRNRVRMARLPVQYVQLATGPVLKVTDAGLAVAEANRYRPMLESFATVALANGVQQISEGRRLDSWLEEMRGRLAGHPFLTLESAGVRVDLILALGGRIARLIDKRTGRNWMRLPQPGDDGYPATGGYEEYSQGDYHTPGWREAYAASDQSADAVTLTATLRNGLRLERRLQFAAHDLEIQSTLTNTAQEPKRAQLRGHPEFAGDRLAGKALWLRRDGAWERRALPPEQVGLPQEIRLEAATLPAGSWALVDEEAGAGLICSFEPSQVALCRADWLARTDRVDLEIYTPEKVLAPGESLALGQRWMLAANRAELERAKG